MCRPPPRCLDACGAESILDAGPERISMSVLDRFSREAVYIGSLGRSLWRLRHTNPESPRTISDIFEEIARDKPSNIAVLYQDRTLSYADLAEGANRYAHWAIRQGIRKGDVVVLFMEGCPEYLMAWLGLVK